MSSDNFLELLNQVGGWTGFAIVRWTTEDSLGPDALGLPAPRIIIELAPDDSIKHCSRCGTPVERIHDVELRRVRDLPLMGYDVWLVFPQARVSCPRCGPTTEALPWLDRYQRMTKRLADLVGRLAQRLAITEVAALLHLNWDAVKQLHARALALRLGPQEESDFSGVRRIAVDEFALHKGQTYATLVVDVDTRRVLWVARGRDAAALAGFFAAIGPAGCARLEAVAMDLSRPFVKAVREHCPKAKIVSDLFHMLVRYTEQVLDRVRRDEANRLARPSRHEQRERSQKLRRIITGKGMRWLLLRDGNRLSSPTDRVRLDELLAANHSIFIAYVLKEDLRALWGERDPERARAALESWFAKASESRIPALKRFARQLALSADYVINHAIHPIHTSLIEGINNKIKVMKRMAYGYRDDLYFFLKIRAAFPGIPG